VGRRRRGRLIYVREVELFEALKSVFPDLMPLSATDRADGVTGDAYIEMKCRRTHYPTLLIEKKKCDLGALEEPQWVLMALPDKTDFANSGKVQKLAAYLDIRLAELLLV